MNKQMSENTCMSFFTDSGRIVDYSSLSRKDRLKYSWKRRQSRCNFLNERRGVEVIITPASYIWARNSVHPRKFRNSDLKNGTPAVQLTQMVQGRYKRARLSHVYFNS
jgi:hypothetical protein